MIKSTTPQLIDAQNQISEIVYFDMGPAIHDRKKGLRKFNITIYIEDTDVNGDTYYKGIKEEMSVFKEATFMGLWGNLTLIEFEAQVDANLISQIDYINSYTWDDTEAQAPVRFWNLTASDLEIVV